MNNEQIENIIKLAILIAVIFLCIRFFKYYLFTLFIVGSLLIIGISIHAFFVGKADFAHLIAGGAYIAIWYAARDDISDYWNRFKNNLSR